VHLSNHSHLRKKKRTAFYILCATIGIVIGAGIIGYPKFISFINRIHLEEENQNVMTAIVEGKILEKTIENIQNIPEEVEKELVEPVVILENAYLEVPFVCQAPFQTEANWIYHEESCEEAALLQAHYYIEGIKEANKETANSTILDMIKWQEGSFGEHKDLYANDMKIFIKGYYGYTDDDIEIIYDADVVDIKKTISMGYPVIVPIMGDILRNPYYPYPGYHMLTVIGYTPESIITNDVGTRRGKDFSYKYETFMNAMNAAGGDILYIKKQPLSQVVNTENLAE
jgi:hypothetical protein